MPNQSYIETHELWSAFQAVSLCGAGFAELQTLHDYDVDPLADDFETQVRDAINDQVLSEQISASHKMGRAA